MQFRIKWPTILVYNLLLVSDISSAVWCPWHEVPCLWCRACVNDCSSSGCVVVCRLMLWHNIWYSVIIMLFFQALIILWLMAICFSFLTSTRSLFRGVFRSSPISSTVYKGIAASVPLWKVSDRFSWHYLTHRQPARVPVHLPSALNSFLWISFETYLYSVLSKLVAEHYVPVPKVKSI